MQGTEKQIAWATDIKSKIENKIETSIESKKIQIKTAIPARWNTEEKIAKGLAKREEKNTRLNDAIAKFEIRLQK